MQQFLGIVRHIAKWGGIGILSLGLVLPVAAVIAYTHLHRSLPQLSGEVQIVGVTGPVEIVRDRYAVPHIRAANGGDIFFGLGYVHAQDRLWQMEFTRRIAQGRLSEMVGPLAVTPDIYLRALDLDRAAQSALDALPASTRTKLESYTAGVNAVIGADDRPLPPEFFILQHTPEPWTPKDSVMLVKFLALGLSGNVFSEFVRTRLLDQLSEQQLAEFMPPAAGNLDMLKNLYAESGVDRLFAALPAPPLKAASNNWVVSGKHTETGKPLLANDPHLGLTAPSVWYMAHLAFEEGSVIGGTMPGMPAVLTGRNEHIAWGLTTTGADTQDLFIERLNPDNENEYLTPDGYVPFETWEETIKVRFGTDRLVTLKRSRNGPIVPTDGFLEDLALNGHALAFSWAALHDGDQTVHGGITAMFAKNWPEFREAMKSYHAPMQSIVYGDVDGNIALIAPALVPVRKADNDTKGLIPAPGWQEPYQWDGFIPFDGLPQYLNPESGMLVTANDRIVDETYPYAVTLEWESDERARRIRTLLQERPQHTLDSFRVIQMDEVSQLALDLLPIIRSHLHGYGGGSDLERDALDRLVTWNGDMAGDRPEPLIFAALIREMNRSTYEDELGEHFNLVSRTRKEFLRRVYDKQGDLAHWCPEAGQESDRTCAEVVRRSFSAALAWIEGRYGPRLSTWQWGLAHPATHTHRPLGSVPILGGYFNVIHPSGGSGATVNRGGVSGSDRKPFANVHGSGYRGIYDFADLDRSLYMQSSGQSGNVLSRHYDDLTELWARGDYMTMTTNFEDILSGDASVLRLMPRKQANETAAAP